MNTIAFVIFIVGTVSVWWMDADFYKDARVSEKRSCALLLIAAVGLFLIKKLNVSIVVPSEVLIQSIVPWMKQFLTGG